LAQWNAVSWCVDSKAIVLFTDPQEKETMANVTKVILVAAIAAASIATPALAAHKGKPISAHQNGYVARGSLGSGALCPSDYQLWGQTYSYCGW
jgi:hypothetical protein